MDGIFEWCLNSMAIFIFCMALSLCFYQKSQIHRQMELWKNIAQIEKDVGTSNGEY